MFKQIIVKILAEKIRLKKEEIEEILEEPPSLELGDFSLPCFFLSKKLKKSPIEISQNLKEKLSQNLPKEIEKIESKGPYLNFFTNKKILAEQVIKINSNFGRQKIGKKEKIVIDFSAPNIGKPMHIGHIRSTIIGDSLMRIFDFLNYNAIGINYLGDVGLHIGKLIVAYELWLDKEALKKDAVKELLRLYVKFCTEEKSQITDGMEVEEFEDNQWTNKAKEKIKLLELGDKKTHEIWNIIRKSSEKGFDKVYGMLKINFTETTGQSYFEKRGKELITDALLKENVKADSDNAIFIETNNQKKYILRSNQTATYMTYDIGAAYERHKKYNFQKMIYVTDYRQSDHFKHLFSILKLFGYDWADTLSHLPFGTINFGKEIMATREGKIIHLEEVLKKTIDKAEEEIKKRKTKGNPEKVGVGAIKYIILKNEPIKDVNFSWEQSLNFEGNTGPYLQYSFARASSILRKAKNKNFNKGKTNLENLSKEEISLISNISKFPNIINQSAKRMNPAVIANYSYELAKSFNDFYHNCLVLGNEQESFRLRLIEAFIKTLKNSLHLLGIEVMEEM